MLKLNLPKSIPALDKFSDLNTSHVKVKQIKEEEIEEPKEFKYISC